MEMTDDLVTRRIRELWIISFERKLQRRFYIAPLRYLSIYRVTSGLAKHKMKPYMPSTISLGPYDHGKSMDQEKDVALRRFLAETGMPFSRLVGPMESVKNLLEEFYELPEDKRSYPNGFLGMMIVDGFFVLSVLCFLASDNSVFTYERSGIIDEIAFSFRRCWGSYLLPEIRRDMLLLENQLPILLLWKLMEALGGKAKDVNMLILSFLHLKPQPTDVTNEWPEMVDKTNNWPEIVHAFGLHILDVYRRRKFPSSMLVVEEVSSLLGNQSISWSATKLEIAGVQFRKSHSESFNDITFSCGILQLPHIDIDDAIETFLLNAMAFEYHYASTRYVDATCYLYFMGRLISSSSDVALLRSKGIIHLHGRRSDDDVANLFKMVLEEVRQDIKEIVSKVGKELNDYLMH